MYYWNPIIAILLNAMLVVISVGLAALFVLGCYFAFPAMPLHIGSDNPALFWIYPRVFMIVGTFAVCILVAVYVYFTLKDTLRILGMSYREYYQN